MYRVVSIELTVVWTSSSRRVVSTSCRGVLGRVLGCIVIGRLTRLSLVW